MVNKLLKLDMSPLPSSPYWGRGSIPQIFFSDHQSISGCSPLSPPVLGAGLALFPPPWFSCPVEEGLEVGLVLFFLSIMLRGSSSTSASAVSPPVMHTCLATAACAPWASCLLVLSSLFYIGFVIVMVNRRKGMKRATKIPPI